MFACPCCGFLTFSKEPPGTFDICPVCSWIDDIAQYHDQNSKEGANSVSLEEARRNYALIGAISHEEIKNVRFPKPNENTLYEKIKSTLPLAIPDFILKDAISLAPNQPYEVGWTKKTINKILTFLEYSDIPIIGGDVYECKSGKVKPVYVNWHCDQRDGESLSDFANRSRKETFQFVNSYNDTENDDIFYVLVFLKNRDSGE